MTSTGDSGASSAASTAHNPGPCHVHDGARRRLRSVTEHAFSHVESSGPADLAANPMPMDPPARRLRIQRNCFPLRRPAAGARREAAGLYAGGCRATPTGISGWESLTAVSAGTGVLAEMADSVSGGIRTSQGTLGRAAGGRDRSSPAGSRPRNSRARVSVRERPGGGRNARRVGRARGGGRSRARSRLYLPARHLGYQSLVVNRR